VPSAIVDMSTLKVVGIMAEQTVSQRVEALSKRVKREPGPGYVHTDEHVDEYGRLGVISEDHDIGRAWARLYDAGHNAGPAVGKPYTAADGKERQLFQYAWAERDPDPKNINHMVTFHFGGIYKFTESGLGHEVKKPEQS
jgi:hypothetical protein